MEGREEKLLTEIWIAECQNRGGNDKILMGVKTGEKGKVKRNNER